MTRALIFLLALGACTAVPSARADCFGTSDCRPAVAMTALDGAVLGGETLQDKVVLVNFWATWCAPCLREIPALRAVYERHKAEGFTIVGMVTGDDATDVEVKTFATRRGMSYPLVRSKPDVEQSFGMGQALPTSVLYDRRGRLVRRWEGDISEAALEDLVKRSLLKTE